MEWNVPVIAVFKLPSTVLTQRKAGIFSCCSGARAATIGSCRQPALVTALKQPRPSETTRARRKMSTCHALDVLASVLGNLQEQALRPARIAGGDGDHERDLVGSLATALSALQLGLLATQDCVVHLDTPIELSGRFVLQHHGAELLAHEPGAIPLEVELA